MDRSNVDKDNISQRSQGGRPLHTYTPQSHEDLLKSHLQLDAARKAKLNNDLQRLTAENDKLRRQLEKSHKDLRDKDDEVIALKSEIRGKSKPQYSSLPRDDFDHNPVFEVDGKPVTLDDLLHHFYTVIQRHHDLLNEKNRLIQDLKDALNNQPMQRVPTKMEAETQSPIPENNGELQQNIMNEFTDQLTLIRKEYEQVQDVLTNRNQRLETLIEDLQAKLDQYATEIKHLREELANRGDTQPNESTLRLIQDKEKENDYLKEIISGLTDRRPSNVNVHQITQYPNEELENELKKIIENKKGAINSLNTMIQEIKKESPDLEIAPEKLNLPEVENDCQTMIKDLNDMKERLNSILKNLKEFPAPTQGEQSDKNDLIPNLENLKKQCQDEIDILTNRIGPTRDGEELVTSKKPIEGLPNVKFVTDPSPQFQLTERPPSSTLDEPQISFKDAKQLPPDQLSKHKHYPVVPCEACSGANLPTDQNKLFMPHKAPQEKKPQQQLKSPKTLWESITPPPKTKLVEDFFAHETPPQEYYARPHSKERTSKPKSKVGSCCRGQRSDTSTVPYSKYPDEEVVVNVHSPYHPSSQTSKSLYPVLKKHKTSDELITGERSDNTKAEKYPATKNKFRK